MSRERKPQKTNFIFPRFKPRQWMTIKATGKMAWCDSASPYHSTHLYAMFSEQGQHRTYLGAFAEHELEMPPKQGGFEATTPDTDILHL